MPEYLSCHKDTSACVQHTEPASKQPKEQREPLGAAVTSARAELQPRGPYPRKRSSGSTQLDEEEPSPAGSCLGTKTLSAQALLFLVQKGERKKKNTNPCQRRSQVNCLLVFGAQDLQCSPGTQTRLCWVEKTSC